VVVWIRVDSLVDATVSDKITLAITGDIRAAHADGLCGDPSLADTAEHRPTGAIVEQGNGFGNIDADQSHHH
jgi:hypothetical protein